MRSLILVEEAIALLSAASKHDGPAATGLLLGIGYTVIFKPIRIKQANNAAIVT